MECQFVQLANRAIAELRGGVEIVPARKPEFLVLAKAALLMPSVAEAFEEISGKSKPASVLPCLLMKAESLRCLGGNL